MKSTIDARGLSCPQPVLMTLDEIKKTSENEILVIVDNDASKENVCRAVENRGWKVMKIDEENHAFHILVHRGMV